MLYRPTDPTQPLRDLEALGKQWQSVAPLLFVADQRRVPEIPDQDGIYDFLGVGTGVLVRYAGRPFLVTALHVIEDTRLTPTVYAHIAGRSTCLGGLPFVPDVAEHVAAAYLDPAWREREGITTLPAVPLRDDRRSFRPTRRHVLLGYPGLENLRRRRPRRDGAPAAHSYGRAGRRPAAERPRRDAGRVPLRPREGDGREPRPGAGAGLP